MNRQPSDRFVLLLAPLFLAAPGALFSQENSTPPTEVLSAVAIVLDRHGCVPAEVVFPAGTNLLEVVNRTGFDAITYHVRSTAQSAGPASITLLDFTLNGRHSRAYHHLKLETGPYQMTLDNGARWQCSISVK